jgi:AhpD family alkylhydroperoxidase
MARLPYADPDAPHLEGLTQKIIAERGEVLDLYQMLLHSPAVAAGWLELLTAIRQKTSLPGSLRELVIIRIAHLNHASYEADQHVPVALREGATGDQLMALPDWESAPHLYSEEQRTALALTDGMTRNVQIGNALWRQVRAAWPDETIVDLVATIASYNMVSRFLEALEIHADKGSA